MNNCTDYLDLISAFTDGAISDEEKIRLDAHLSECPQCAGLLKAFYEITAALEESAVPAPEGFSGGVMARITNASEYTSDEDETQGAESADARNKRIRRRKVTMRYASAAACLAIIILFAGKLSGIGQKFALPQINNEMTMSGLQSGNNTAGAGTSSTMDAGYGGSEDAPPAEIPFAAPSSASEAGEIHTEQADLRETEAEPHLYEITSQSGHKSGDYYAVIYIMGELPEILEEYEREDTGGGVYNIYIAKETADELIELGYESEPGNEDSADAMVIYTPE